MITIVDVNQRQITISPSTGEQPFVYSVKIVDKQVKK